MDSITLLDHLKSQIGHSGLIIQAKALELTNKTKLSLSEIERLLLVLTSNDNLLNSELEKIKFISVLNYFRAENDAENSNRIISNIDYLQNSNKILLRNSVNLEHLHNLFNYIEFHDKFKFLNSEKLNLIKNILAAYEKLDKPFEEYILYKYYKAILHFYLYDYNAAKTCSFEIVCDISDELPKKTPFVEYIELKTSILNIKILEAEGNYREALTNMEGLYETSYQTDDMVAIKLSFKICDLQLNYYNYDKALNILTQIYKKIKKLMLLGFHSKFPEMMEISLNLVSRVIYCNIMMGRTEECIKFVKKLEKLTQMLKDIQLKNTSQIEAKENLSTRYNFYLLIFKNICRYGNLNRIEHNVAINNYREKFKNQINYEQDVITNICAFNSSDTLASNFSKFINENMSIVTSNKSQSAKYLFLFFSLFIQISNLTKNLTTDTNFKKQYEYVEKIRNCSKSIVNYINKYINNNEELKYIFSFPYFKEVLIKIYFSLIFSYYFTKEFKIALELIENFEDLKQRFSLDDGVMIKNYINIIKLKADILFKMEEYSQACNYYAKVIRFYEDILNSSQSLALVLFNIGLCYLYTKEYTLAKKNITLSKCKYELLNSINQGQFTDKIKIINNIINNLSQIFTD